MDDENFGPVGIRDSASWVGQKAKYGGFDWIITSAANAISNLPSRSGDVHPDGTPVNVPLKNTFVVLLGREDGNGGMIEEGVFGCAYCGLLRDKRGQITAHLKECTGNQGASPDYYSLSVDALVGLAKIGARASRRIADLEAKLQEESAARRSAEHTLKILNGALDRIRNR